MLGRRRITAYMAVVAVMAVVAGCGGSTATAAHPGTTSTTVKGPNPNAPEVVAPGDIPDTQAFVPFVGPGFKVSVPEGWARSDSPTVTTFTDHYNTVALATAPAGAAPTVASVQSSVVPGLRSTVPNFEATGVTTVQRSAGPAVLLTYRAGSTPNPVTGRRIAIDVERYEFWRKGTRVTLTLTGARGSDNVDPWKTITNSFAWSP